ncbi:hypothetical protein ACJX0J_003469, partial [Zea mays]
LNQLMLTTARATFLMRDIQGVPPPLHHHGGYRYRHTELSAKHHICLVIVGRIGPK